MEKFIPNIEISCGKREIQHLFCFGQDVKFTYFVNKKVHQTNKAKRTVMKIWIPRQSIKVESDIALSKLTKMELNLVVCAYITALGLEA